MKIEIDIKKGIGTNPSELEMHNDIEILSTTRDQFYNDYKLNKIKCWHIPGCTIIGIELNFINPRTGDLLCPGPHIGYAYDERVTSAELILGYDEYLTELNGCAKTTIDFLHFHTNKGRYAEFGNALALGAFKYKIPRGYSIFSLLVGIRDTLSYIAVQPIQIKNIPLELSPASEMAPTNNYQPSTIVKSKYYGIEKQFSLTVDDFYALQLHPHIKRKTSKIIGINTSAGRRIYGLEILYNKNEKFESSSYNYSNSSRSEKTTCYSLQIEENDYLVGISGYVDGKGLSMVEFCTANEKRWRYGKAKGEAFVIPNENRLEIVALRGTFMSTQVLGVSAYFA
ncbi:unnamed protein product [Blepharisma stoltei]|uniref:Jacalin-type lectin domain-containing protein n=1 Tax=Blepharisma stoltei TaxID=1481888 RepID=A0AAU9ITS9_9CILI|nr:unnamed protein product [Blepharisma stoltei]